MDQENNINNGRDQIIINQPKTVNFQDSTSLPKLPKLEPKAKAYVLNYLLTLISLISYLITWILLGLVAKSEFPIVYVWKLIVVCLKGSEEFSVFINDKQREINQLEKITLEAQENTKEENSRLNKLDSKIIVLDNIIKRLYKEIKTKEESVSIILNQLENQRKFVQINLEPLREEYDPNLYKLERVLQVLLEGKSAAERDYEHVEHRLKELIEKYGIESELPSIDSASNIIQDLRQVIDENRDNIRPSRLNTLRYTLNLLQWIFSLKNSSYSPESTPFNPDEENFSEFDRETSSDIKDNLNIKAHDDNSSSLCSTEDLSDNESDKNGNINSREIREKPQGEFVNKSRLESINALIEKVIKETTDTRQEWIEKIKIGVERKWINQISIYVFDKKKKSNEVDWVKRELALKFDWDNQEFNFQKNSRSPADLEELILNFQEFSREQEVTPKWRVYYTHPENTEYYNRKLGFKSGKPVQWATHSEESKAAASGLSNVFIELNFGPSKHQSFRSPKSVSGCLAALGIAGIVFLSLWSFSQQPRSLPPQSSPSIVLTSQEQIGWKQLHKSISVWDVKTAQRNLALLSQSQNSCISEFSTKLKITLKNKGPVGFKDVNQIKRTLNKQRECNFVITP